MVDLSRSEMAKRILDVIPCDRWVSAAEISVETGIDSIQVAGTIKRNLLGAYVERRRDSPHRPRCQLYRRLRHVNKTKSWHSRR